MNEEDKAFVLQALSEVEQHGLSPVDVTRLLAILAKMALYGKT